MTHFFVPLGGRVSGDASFPRPSVDTYPANEKSASGCAVGVVDTGLVLHDGSPHPWLAGHVKFTPFVDADPLPIDGSDPTLGTTGHGTFVTGVILREAPTAMVTMKGVLDKTTGEAEDTAVAAAIDALNLEGIKLINLSFGGDIQEQGPPPVIGRAMQRLPSDVVVVVAAGNSGEQRPFYPAAFDLGVGGARVIAVGAVNVRDLSPDGLPLVADFSNHGRWVSAYASGVDVLGPYLGFGGDVPGYGGWATWSGTSFASAVVTGRIAQWVAENDVSVAAAVGQVLAACSTIPVWGVNGQTPVPYVVSCA